MALIGQSSKDAAWAFWLSLVVGPLAAAVFAFVISYAVLRTRHYYFFLSTFAAGEALRQCFIQLSGITGGAYGIPFVGRPSPQLGMDFTTTTGFYYLALVFFVAVSVGLYLLDHSRLGRTIKAAAANETLSESVGINVTAHRTLAFVVGSGVAGLAGVLFASFNGTINPMDFSAVLMFKVVAAAIVGGTATFFGPLLGLLYLTALEEGLRTIPQWVPLLWGASVVIVLLLLPGGLESLFVRIFLGREPGADGRSGRSR
jgi:branched-chain amino acid transport system permease protein